MKFYITGSLFSSIFNFVILRVLGAFVVQILFLTALFGINWKSCVSFLIDLFYHKEFGEDGEKGSLISLSSLVNYVTIVNLLYQLIYAQYLKEWFIQTRKIAGYDNY